MVRNKERGREKDQDGMERKLGRRKEERGKEKKWENRRKKKNRRYQCTCSCIKFIIKLVLNEDIDASMCRFKLELFGEKRLR